jgi:type 1 fimbria pilin
LTIDPNAATGSQIEEFTLTLSIANGGITCTSTMGWYDDIPLGSPLGNSIYATNIPGIGYRVRAATGFQPWSHYVGERGGNWASSTRRYVLVKTGTISRGGTLSGLGFTTYVRSHRATIWREVVPTISIQLLTRPTCRLNNTSIPVNFGVVPITATNGQLVQRPLSLSVFCSGGSAGQTTPVRVTFTDANNTGNRSNNLTISPANSGMTINLRYNGTAIFFGPQSSAAGNVGQFLLGNAGNATYNYNLTSHLMRNGAMRGLDAFSARATMTMRYE